MTVVLAISVAIILIVLLLSVLTTSKAYSYEHKIDPLEGNPLLDERKTEDDQEK